MDLLGVMEMFVVRTWKVSAADVTLEGMPQTVIACHWHFRTSLFHITHYFYDYDLHDALPKNFCTSH